MSLILHHTTLFAETFKIKNMKKIVWINGIIAGLIVTVLMIIGMKMLNGNNIDFAMAEIMGFSSMIIALSLIFFAIKRYRDSNQNGQITFGTAFKVGLYISLIASTMYVAGYMLFFSETEVRVFIEDWVELEIKTIESSDLSEVEKREKIAETEASIDTYLNPLWRTLYTYMEILPLALVVTLICAGILKKKPETANPSTT